MIKKLGDLKPDKIANMGVSRTFQNIELFENMTTLRQYFNWCT
ncbi:MAG: hypothetical protein ACJ0GJ_04240 [Candidatus Actinomarina sp.]